MIPEKYQTWSHVIFKMIVLKCLMFSSIDIVHQGCEGLSQVGHMPLPEPMITRSDGEAILHYWATVIPDYIHKNIYSVNIPSAIYVEVIICHYDVITWKEFLHYWLFVWGTTSCRWTPFTRRASNVIFSLLFAWRSWWTNGQVANDFRCLNAHVASHNNNKGVIYCCDILRLSTKMKINH